MKAYADSSFIAALYLPQSHFDAANAFMQKAGEPLPFNPWHRMEVRIAIRLAVFHRVIDSADGRTLLKHLDTDVREESLLVHTPVDWVAVLREAEKLGGGFSETIGCRSGDLFHVAAALESGAEVFLSFDGRQNKMAEAAGLVLGI